MPRKNDAVAIGRMDCLKDGARASVYQAANGFFYTRCPTCKATQNRGQDFQIAVWQRLEPIAGAKDADGVPVVIRRPPNVPESAGEMGAVLAGTAPAVTVIVPTEPAGTAPAEPAPVPADVPENLPAESVQNLPEPAAKPEPAPVPAPKGTGTERRRRGGGAGFWLVLGTLAAGVGAIVHFATKEAA